MSTASGVWRIAWSIFWKTVIAGVILGVIVNFVFSLFLPPILVSIGGQGERLLQSLTYIAFAISLACYFIAFKFALEYALGKEIAGRRLDVVTIAQVEGPHAN
ncbi:hypothetical protein EH240_08980 [Mesorhizobium tamadayense]|uniref:Uncharacterized protein n=1 Tax=Mesorhizobium tamadayense TaxID=425306 RepID=A0A3P3FZU3_9HYPH|nr:hypothetical protein [Mesorhizobium tamadayense]RRI03832.1 hypothetical protein EH240_08980 [Mesorhizobium tamadayense]